MKKSIFKVSARWIDAAYKNRWLIVSSGIEIAGIVILVDSFGWFPVLGLIMLITGNNGTQRIENNKKIKKVASYLIDKLY